MIFIILTTLLAVNATTFEFRKLGDTFDDRDFPVGMLWDTTDPSGRKYQAYYMRGGRQYFADIDAEDDANGRPIFHDRNGYRFVISSTNTKTDPVEVEALDEDERETVFVAPITRTVQAPVGFWTGFINGSLEIRPTTRTWPQFALDASIQSTRICARWLTKGVCAVWENVVTPILGARRPAAPLAPLGGAAAPVRTPLAPVGTPLASVGGAARPLGGVARTTVVSAPLDGGMHASAAEASYGRFGYAAAPPPPPPSRFVPPPRSAYIPLTPAEVATARSKTAAAKVPAKKAMEVSSIPLVNGAGPDIISSWPVWPKDLPAYPAVPAIPVPRSWKQFGRDFATGVRDNVFRPVKNAGAALIGGTLSAGLATAGFTYNLGAKAVSTCYANCVAGFQFCEACVSHTKTTDTPKEPERAEYTLRDDEEWEYYEAEVDKED